MRFRKRMSRRSSRKNFRRGARRIHARNNTPMPMRGGFRI